MISYNQKEILKEEAKKARQAKVMQAIQSRTTSTPKSNSMLFNEPVRVSSNPKNHSAMHQTIKKVLGDYDIVVEEMSKQQSHIIGIDKQTRSVRDTNHQVKGPKMRCNGYKMRPQTSSKGMIGKDDAPRSQDASSHGRCSGSGSSSSGSSSCSGNSSASYLSHGHGHQDGSRQGLLDTPPDGAYSRNSQNSHSMSKEGGHGQNSIDNNYRSRVSQNSRLSTSSRMLSEKHGPDKDFHPKKHLYSQNSFISPNNKVYSTSSSSSSTQFSKHHPYPNVTTNSGNAHLKSSRPLSSSLSDKSSSHGSNSEKYYRDKYHSGSEKSLQVEKFHSSADKGHADHKQYGDKTHNESKELSSNVDTSEKSISNNSGREKPYSAEKGISHHHLTKTKSRSPMPFLTPSVQSQQQGPPLLQSQQQPQLQLQQPSKGPAASSAIASTPPPPLTMDGSRENHHTSLPSPLSPAYNATNNVSSKPFLSTHLNKSLSNSLKVKTIGPNPAKGSSDHDDSESDNQPLKIERIMKEMCQPEKITGIKTPSVKENRDEEKNFLSPTDHGQKHLLSELNVARHKPSTPVHQIKLKAISPSLTLHRFQKQNLNTSPELSDLKEEKNDLDKILAEMTCRESPVTAISTPEKMPENPFARAFKNSHSPSQKALGLYDTDSDSSDNEEDTTQTPHDKPVHSCSSDDNANNQTDASILKESKNMTLAPTEIKNHQNADSVGENQLLKTSPLESTSPTAMSIFPSNDVKCSLQSQEDLSQDLQMSDSDSEALDSTKEFPPIFTLAKSPPSSPTSRLHHPMDISAVETRKDSVGFDIFSEHQTSESDSENDEVVAKTKSSTLAVSNSAVTESNTVCNNTPLVYSTPARKGSGQFAKKNDNDADDEEDEDVDDDDDQSDVEESTELSRVSSAAKHQKPDVVSSSSTSDSDTSDDESNVSEKASSASDDDDDDDDNDEEEEDEDKHDRSKQLNSVEGVNDAEQCDSASVQKSVTPRWCLRAFLPDSNNKTSRVTKEAEEIVSVSSHTGSNVSASQRSRSNSSSSSSNSSSSSSSSSSSCNENSSPVPEANSHCESEDDSNSEKSSAEKTSLIPSDNEEPPSSCHKQDVVDGKLFTEDITSKESGLQANNTKSVTNLSTWPPGKDIREYSSPVSSPMSASPTSSLVHRKLKRKISLHICINTNLLSSIPNVKCRKLSTEPSQPAEHLDTIKSEAVPNTWSNQIQPQSQESVEKKPENKQLWTKPDKSPKRRPNNTEFNCCQKRPLTIKINTNLLHFIPAKCLKDLPSLQDVKTENNVEEAVVQPEMQNGNSSPSVKVNEPNANTESFVMTQTTTTPILTEITPCKAEKSDFKFRIPKRNLDSESYDISRPSPKMMKTDGQVSKNEDNQLPNISKSEPVKSLCLVNSDNNNSSPSTESSTAISKSRISDKDNQISSIDDTKQPCHDKEKDNAVLPASPSECNSSGCSSSSNSNNNNSNNNGDDDIDDDVDDDDDSEHDDSDHDDHDENDKKHSSSSNQNINALTNSSSNKKPKTPIQTNLTSKSSSDISKDTGKAAAVLPTLSPSMQSNSSSVLLSPKGSTTGNTSDHHQPSTSVINPIPVTPSNANSSNSLRSRPLYKGSGSNHSSSGGDGCGSSHKGKEKADHFFQEAKRMKHEGNKLTDIFEKSFLYMNAVVSYVQCGIALEKDQEQRCFRMFGEIFDFLNQIGHYHQYPNEQKISLLRLLLMSRVCKKLYDMKKKVADNLRLAIDEYNKQSNSTSLPSHTPSPHRPNWNTSTPSSRSTPSPSGSIDSIRSQGSNASDAKLTPSASSSNAVSATSHSSSHISNNSCPSSSSSSNLNSSGLTGSSLPSSSQTVTIPKRIHSITQNYIEILDYIVKTHNYWEQAEIQKENCKDFIDLLHTRCKYISLQSSIFQYVEYVRVGLQILRES